MYTVGVYIKRGVVLEKEVPIPPSGISIVFYFPEDMPLLWYGNSGQNRGQGTGDTTQSLYLQGFTG
jgi:hypothetical protein